jgi:G3E family GTPase
MKNFFPQLYLYRDNGVNAIENLTKKKGRFDDPILLETSGLADPGMSIFSLTESCILYSNIWILHYRIDCFTFLAWQ